MLRQSIAILNVTPPITSKQSLYVRGAAGASHRLPTCRSGRLHNHQHPSQHRNPHRIFPRRLQGLQSSFIGVYVRFRLKIPDAVFGVQGHKRPGGTSNRTQQESPQQKKRCKGATHTPSVAVKPTKKRTVCLRFIKKLISGFPDPIFSHTSQDESHLSPNSHRESNTAQQRILHG